MGWDRGVPFARYSAIPHSLLVRLVPKPSQPRAGDKWWELHNDLHQRRSENMGSIYKLCGVHVDRSHVDRSNVDGGSIHDNDFTTVDIFNTSCCCWRSYLDCDSD
jgi:hypothetical protein